MKNLLLPILLMISVTCFGQDDSKAKTCQDKLTEATDDYEKLSKKSIAQIRRIDILLDSIILIEQRCGDGSLPDEEIEQERNLCQTRIDEAKGQIAELNGQVRGLKRKNKNLNDQIAALKAENATLKAEIENLNNLIAQLEADLDKLQKENDRLQAIVDCMDSFVKARQTARTAARIEIDKANSLITFLGYNGATTSEELTEEVKNQRINEAFDIYQEYGGSTNTTNCGGRELSYNDDYLTGRENLTLAKIVADNKGNVMERLGPNIKCKTNAMNRLLLVNVGKAIEKGDYNTRSDALAYAKKISYYIFVERKGVEDCDEPDFAATSPDADADADSEKSFASSDMKRSISKIKSEFDAGNYPASIELYNQLQRFLTLDEVKRDKTLVANAHFAAGVILAWDLAAVSTYRDAFLEGTWLNQNLNDGINVGRRLLEEEVIEKDSLPLDLRRKATLALRKQYK